MPDRNFIVVIATLLGSYGMLLSLQAEPEEPIKADSSAEVATSRKAMIPPRAVPAIDFVDEHRMREVAKRTGKPIWILFTATKNCPPCDVLESRTFKSQLVRNMAGKYVCVKVTDQKRKLAWKNERTPMSMFCRFDRLGKLVIVYANGLRSQVTKTNPSLLYSQLESGLKAAKSL